MVRRREPIPSSAATILIGVVGDFDQSRATHVATEAAIAHAAAALPVRVEVRWLSTELLERAAPTALAGVDGFCIAPGSPYRSMQGALRAIRVAREGGVPLLGTCAGFQHTVIEYARNVLGISDANHAEYDPDGARLVVTALECSLFGDRAVVHLAPGSHIRDIYGAAWVEEEFRCNFGLNPAYREALEAAGLLVVGTDSAGAPRVVELRTPSFFIATLYVPQLSSSAERPHPVLTAFVAAAARYHES